MPSVGKIESTLLLTISLTARNSSHGFRKPSLRTIYCFLDVEFSQTTSWAISGDVFDVRDKFLVSDPMTTVGRMSFVRNKE